MIAELWLREYLDGGGIWTVAPTLRAAARARLRIVSVSDVSLAAPGGGAERMLWEQASRLGARGHGVVAVCRGTETARAVEEHAGVRITHFPVARGSLLRFVRGSIVAARRAAAAELARQPADVLHFHQPLSAYGILRSSVGRTVPSLYSFYSPAPLEYLSRRGMTLHHRGGVAGMLGARLLGRIEAAALRRAGAIHVLSDFSAGQLSTLYRIPGERIVKIPAGVDLDAFRPSADRRALRGALGLPLDRRLVLSVRNLEHRMGLDLLIRAMALIRDTHRDLLLVVGGSGSRRAELETLTRDLGLAADVRFVGFIPEPSLPHYYQAADVFVLPTRELEGFGLVTIESLACGTPVLGTPVGATPEILSPLAPSLLFRDASAAAIADGLARFFADHGAGADGGVVLRAACRDYAARHYTWDRAVARLEATLVDRAERRRP
jgi:glycosyltransferase involved in cell wall biosynthesis